MIDDIEGFFEVHKQGTNGALVIKGFHPRMLDRDQRKSSGPTRTAAELVYGLLFYSTALDVTGSGYCQAQFTRRHYCRACVQPKIALGYGVKVLGTFAPKELNFHRGKSSNE